MDEVVHDCIRGRFVDKLPTEVSSLYQKYFNLNNKTPQQENLNDIKQRHDKVLGFIARVNANNNITLKYYPQSCRPAKPIIEYALANNFNLFFLYRKDRIQQIAALINAYERHQYIIKNKIKNRNGFVNFDNSLEHTIPYNINNMATALTVLSDSFNTWECLHARYSKFSTTLCYEESIAINDFSLAGISTEHVANYSKQSISVKPTTTHTPIENWDKFDKLIRQYIL